MLIEHIIGNSNDPQFKNNSIDRVNIEWYDSKNKLHRLTSQKGRDVAIRLSPQDQNRGLWQDDVLAVVENDIIVVDIVPSKCIVLSCDNKIKLITLCYETGNRHAPFYYMPETEKFIIPYDRPFEQLLQKLNLSFNIENVQLDNRWQICASAGHNHSHVHMKGSHTNAAAHE